MKKNKKVSLLLDFLIWHENNRSKRGHLILGKIVEEYLKQTHKKPINP